MDKSNRQIDFRPLDGFKFIHNPVSLLTFGIFGIFMLVLASAFTKLWAVWVLVIVIVAVLFAYLHNRQQAEMKASQEKLLNFAHTNNFQLQVIASFSEEDKSTVFSQGTDRKLFNELSGTFSGLPFRMFGYKYTVQSGKSSRTYDLQAIELTLPRVLPHMVIDSLVEYGNQNGSTLPIEFAASQKINLEGDFHKYFALYAPDTYGISVLSILAPDAMEALMKHAAMCDIEIIDNKIYFLWPDVASSQSQYQEMLNTVEEVMKEIQRKLEKGDIFANNSQARIHVKAKDSGVRLERSKLPVIVFFIAITFYGGVAFFRNFASYETNQAIAGIAQLVYFVLVAVFIVWTLFKSRQKDALRKQLRTRKF